MNRGTDDLDYHRITLSETKTVTVSLTGLSFNASLYINDAEDGAYASSENAGTDDESATRDLEAAVPGQNDHTFTHSVGDYVASRTQAPPAIVLVTPPDNENSATGPR